MQQDQEGTIDPLVQMINLITLVIVLITPPGVILAAIFNQHVKRQQRQPLYWTAALLIGAAGILIDMLFLHVQKDFVNYAIIIISQIEQLQFQFNQFWPSAWPVWLECLPLAPYVAALQALGHRSPAEITIQQKIQGEKSQRQKLADQAHKQLTHQSIPEAIHQKIVLGAPIHGEKEV
jgi:hypothetical protein